MAFQERSHKQRLWLKLSMYKLFLQSTFPMNESLNEFVDDLVVEIVEQCTMTDLIHSQKQDARVVHSPRNVGQMIPSKPWLHAWMHTINKQPLSQIFTKPLVSSIESMAIVTLI